MPTISNIGDDDNADWLRSLRPEGFEGYV